jgi:hypothetical protein
MGNKMTREQIKFVEDLIESGIGNSSEIAKRFSKQYPRSGVDIRCVQDVRRSYCLARLGTSNFAPKRLAAYHIFEDGGSALDVAIQLGMNAKHASQYYRDWILTRSLKTPPVRKPDPERKHAFPGGAIFGEWTRRNTIWRG